MQRNSDGRLGGGERRGEHKSRCIDTAKGMLTYKRAVKGGRRGELYCIQQENVQEKQGEDRDCSVQLGGGEGIPPYERSPPPSRLGEQTADVPAFADCHTTALPLQCGDVWLCNLWKGRQRLQKDSTACRRAEGELTPNETEHYCHQEGEI